jgi:hypothetical protein
MSAFPQPQDATANSLLGISSSNFLSRMKNMTNDEFNKVLGTINSETKRQAFLRRFGNTTNTVLRTRKNKVALLERKLQEQVRKARLTKKVNLPTNNTSPTILNTLTPAQRAERKALNAERNARALPTVPAVVPPKRATGIMTMANLERLGEKKIFVNLSYTPTEGIRPFSYGTKGESTSEKQNVPVIVKEIKSRGYVFLVEVYNIKGVSTHLLLPSPVPLLKGGKIYTVPKSEATLVTDSERNPKKVAVQHAISKDDEALFGISYEAKLFTDKRGVPFFYFLNQSEFKEGANDGIPIYDLPVVPDGFLMSGL